MTLVEVQPRRNIRGEEYVSKFPLSQGKIPGLQGPKIGLTETIAISLVCYEPSWKHQLSANFAIDSILQDFQTPRVY